MKKTLEGFKDRTFLITILFTGNILVSNGQTANDFFKSGNEKNRHEDYKGAITDYEKAIVLNPNFDSAYYNCGISKINLKCQVHRNFFF